MWKWGTLYSYSKIICILLEGLNSQGATPYQSGTYQVSVVSGPEFHFEHDTGEEIQVLHKLVEFQGRSSILNMTLGKRFRYSTS